MNDASLAIKAGVALVRKMVTARGFTWPSRTPGPWDKNLIVQLTKKNRPAMLTITGFTDLCGELEALADVVEARLDALDRLLLATAA